MPAVAVKLVNEYARQFTRYRLELDTNALQTASGALQERMKGLGSVWSAAAASLSTLARAV